MERKKTHKFYSASFKLKVVGVAEQIGKHKASTQFCLHCKIGDQSP